MKKLLLSLLSLIALSPSAMTAVLPGGCIKNNPPSELSPEDITHLYTWAQKVKEGFYISDELAIASRNLGKAYGEYINTLPSEDQRECRGIVEKMHDGLVKEEIVIPGINFNILKDVAKYILESCKENLQVTIGYAYPNSSIVIQNILDTKKSEPVKSALYDFGIALGNVCVSLSSETDLGILEKFISFLMQEYYREMRNKEYSQINIEIIEAFLPAFRGLATSIFTLRYK